MSIFLKYGQNSLTLSDGLKGTELHLNLDHKDDLLSFLSRCSPDYENPVDMSQMGKILLWTSGKEHLTLGHAIASDRTDIAIINQYLHLLENMAKENPGKVLEILAAKTSAGWTLGHFLAHYHRYDYSAAIVQSFLRLLDSLGKNNFPKVWEIVAMKTSGGSTLWHLIASHDDSAIRAQFLAMLENAVADNPDQEVMEILVMTHYDSVCNTVCCNTDALAGDIANISQYFRLLENIAKKNPERVLELLAAEYWDGWMLGHFLIATHQAPTIAYKYLCLLENGGKHNPSKVLKILSTKTSNGFTVGHLIARHKDNSCMGRYLDMLESAWKDNSPKVLEILAMSAINDTYGFTLGDYIKLYYSTNNAKLKTQFEDLETKKSLSLVIAYFEKKLEKMTGLSVDQAHYAPFMKRWEYMQRFIQCEDKIAIAKLGPAPRGIRSQDFSDLMNKLPQDGSLIKFRSQIDDALSEKVAKVIMNYNNPPLVVHKTWFLAWESKQGLPTAPASSDAHIDGFDKRAFYGSGL